MLLFSSFQWATHLQTILSEGASAVVDSSPERGVRIGVQRPGQETGRSLAGQGFG